QSEDSQNIRRPKRGPLNKGGQQVEEADSYNPENREDSEASPPTAHRHPDSVGREVIRGGYFVGKRRVPAAHRCVRDSAGVDFACRQGPNLGRKTWAVLVQEVRTR